MRYTALTYSNEIRLIDLKPQSYHHPPGAKDSILQCELVQVVRGRCPPYTAVSYAWGDKTATSPILISGERHDISATAEEVLRQLQAKDAGVYVWVDQICINQQDNAEKSLQVQQMQHIYSEAEKVVAWLGSTADGSDMLLKHLEMAGEAVWADDVQSLFSAHSNRETIEAIGRAFRALCERVYWRRLWIIQEFAVGSQLCIACGEAMLWDWNLHAFLIFINRLSENVHRFTKGDKAVEAIGRAMVGAYKTSATSFMEGVVTRRSRYWRQQKGYEDHLFRVLVTTLVLEHDYNQPMATDPRDRIFSILSLANDADEFVNFPDYSWTCDDVFLETALVILKQGYIDLLSYCQFPKHTLDIPSWVPDWRTQVHTPCTGAPWSNNFNASADMSSQEGLSSPTPKTIALRGVLVDSIEECGSIWNPNWLHPLDPAATLAYLEDIEAFCTKSPLFLTSTEEEIATARIAIADCNGIGDEVWPEYCAETCRQTVERMKSHTSSSEASSTLPRYGRNPKDVESDEIDRGMDRELSTHSYTTRLRLLHSRLPLISKFGFVGLAPWHVKPGDLICIFLGGKVPYVIWQLHDRSNAYTLIGEAYIHGIMFGEFMIGEPEVRTFVLR